MVLFLVVSICMLTVFFSTPASQISPKYEVFLPNFFSLLNTMTTQCLLPVDRAVHHHQPSLSKSQLHPENATTVSLQKSESLSCHLCATLPFRARPFIRIWSRVKSSSQHYGKRKLKLTVSESNSASIFSYSDILLIANVASCSLEEMNNLMGEAKEEPSTSNGTGEDVTMQDLSDLSDISEGRVTISS